jgi:hypothetical protein
MPLPPLPFADVERVVEDGDAAEVGIFAGLVARKSRAADHVDVRRGGRSLTGKSSSAPVELDQSIPSKVVVICFLDRLPELSLPTM